MPHESPASAAASADQPDSAASSIRTSGELSTVFAVNFGLALTSVMIDGVLIALTYVLSEGFQGAPAFIQALPYVAFAGLIIGQGLILAVFAAIGGGNHVVRVVTGAIAILLASWAIATFLVYPQTGANDWAPVLGVGLMTVMLYCFVQIPFWLLRVVRGWRFGEVATSESSVRFRLEHVLGWSAFLMLPLFLLQFIISLGSGIDLVGFVAVSIVGLIALANGAALIRVAGIAPTGMALVLLLPIALVGSLIFLLALVVTMRAGGQLRMVFPAVVLAHFAGGLYLLAAIRCLRAFGQPFSTRRTRGAKVAEQYEPREDRHPLDF